LREELERMWKVKVTVVPVVIGTLGAVTPKLGERLQQIPGTTSEISVQKSAILGTAKILRRTLTLPGLCIIMIVEWSRADLGLTYVLLYRHEQFDPGNQHPSFKNRVDLRDRQMKDGDVSVILKNVTVNDTGTYECRVFQRGTNRRSRANMEANLDSDPITEFSVSVIRGEAASWLLMFVSKDVEQLICQPNENLPVIANNFNCNVKMDLKKKNKTLCSRICEIDPRNESLFCVMFNQQADKIREDAAC
uniref:Immunoglobulin V-set domain-containing protein n=1 Tax=Amphilophus citrinellus TaxID=61819 RepID=A0A3Q0S451_AMPCI